jgi:hypothetical protein
VEKNEGRGREGCRDNETGINSTEQRKVKRPFKLVPHEHGSSEVVACLRSLLRDAEAGKLIGVAWVAMYKQREWDYMACGEAHRNPAWTIGMLTSFSIKLANDING